MSGARCGACFGFPSDTERSAAQRFPEQQRDAQHRKSSLQALPFLLSPRRPTCPDRCGTLMIVVDKRCSRSPHEAIAWWGKRPVGLWIARGQSLDAAVRTSLRTSVLVELESFLATSTVSVSNQIPVRNGCAQIIITISRISVVKLRDGPFSLPGKTCPAAQQLATSTDFTFCIPTKLPRLPGQRVIRRLSQQCIRQTTSQLSSHLLIRLVHHVNMEVKVSCRRLHLRARDKPGVGEQASACGFQLKLALVADALGGISDWAAGWDSGSSMPEDD